LLTEEIIKIKQKNRWAKGGPYTGPWPGPWTRAMFYLHPGFQEFMQAFALIQIYPTKFFIVIFYLLINNKTITKVWY
jgi:hypothetical protein